MPKKEGIKIYEGPASSARVIGTAQQKNRMKIRHRYGSFWAVDLAPNKVGYVRVLEVTKVDDEEVVLSRSSAENKIKNSSVQDDAAAVRQRSSASVMGLRGLSEDADADQRASLRPNLRAVRAMEERSVSQAKIDQLQLKIFAEIEKLEGKSDAFK